MWRLKFLLSVRFDRVMEIWYALNAVVQLLATVGQGGFGDSLISIIFNELILMRIFNDDFYAGPTRIF